MGIQGAFCVEMIPLISSDPYEAKHKDVVMKLNKDGQCNAANQDNQFAFWRCQIFKGALPVAGSTMAQHACSGDVWTWEESMIANFREYASPALGVLFRAFPIASHGVVFGCIALWLWSAVVVEALRGVTGFAMIAWAHEAIEAKHKFTQSCVLRVVVVIISVLRLALIVGLGFWGGKFLAHTDNVKDFILNSVALQFVVEIPALFYRAFASSHQKDQLAKFNNDANDAPLEAYAPQVLWDWNGDLAFIVGLIFFFVPVFFYLFPFSFNMVSLVDASLCYNTTESVYNHSATLR